MRRAELLFYVAPAAVWSAVLLLMSGGAGASSTTAEILRAVLSATVGAVPDPVFDAMHFLLRKSIHVIAYAIAGALNYRALRAGREDRRFGMVASAVLLAVAVASLDEWHQSFVASRTGVPSDVVIDFCGAVLGVVALSARRTAIPRALRRSE